MGVVDGHAVDELVVVVVAVPDPGEVVPSGWEPVIQQVHEVEVLAGKQRGVTRVMERGGDRVGRVEQARVIVGDAMVAGVLAAQEARSARAAQRRFPDRVFEGDAVIDEE